MHAESIHLNQQFGALTVQSLLSLWDRHEYASCKCNCGNAGLVRIEQLLDGTVDCCGTMPRVESPAKIKADWEKAQNEPVWTPPSRWRQGAVQLLRRAIKRLES